MPEFTPTEKRILQALADDRGHSKQELDRCLGDELAGYNTLSVHITNIRRKLLPIGQTIYCTRLNGHGVEYLHVRLMAGSK